ncbi:hypothetical protein CDV36_016518, partial [Fusarium kuroshium]
MDKFIEQLDPYIEHVAEQWLDAGYHIGISLGCCLLGYGAESNVLMRALSQKPEEIDVAAEANPDETFKQALGFTTRIAETVMRRWGDTNTLPLLHTMLVFVNHMTRFPATISQIEGMFPWKRTSLMLNLVLNSLEPKYDVRSDFRLPENDQLPRPLPEDFAMRGLIYTEDYYPHGWFDNGNIEGRDRYFELRSMTRERKDRLITLGYRIAASGRWLIWNKETRSFTVPKNYDTAIEDPPKPTRDVSKTTSDSPQSKTLHPGRQYWLKVICEAQDGPKREQKRHSKIHEAIEELSRFWESLDGSGKIDDSGSSCVFGCTYMAMGIQLELKGESDVAASYEAEAKTCFEKAHGNSSQYAVRVSTTGIATNGNVEEETWSQLEQWLRNYSLCWLRETGSCRSPVLEEDRWR